jgi:hypothetical protein
MAIHRVPERFALLKDGVLLKMRQILAALLLAHALLPWSTAAAAARRAAVLLIPLDKNAHVAAARFTEYLEESVNRFGTYQLKESAVVLGGSSPTPALEARKRVLLAVTQGRKLLLAGQFDEAEAKFRAALLDVDVASAAMERCSEYCDLLASISSVQLMKGEERGARDTLKQLLALEKGYKFEGPAFGKSFQVLLREVQKGLTRDALLGSLTVQTNPPGGRVFLEGVYRGYAPITLDRLPVGKHLLRIERAGSTTYGTLVEVAAGDESVIRPKLAPTAEYAALESSLDRVADEFERGAAGAELMKMGARLKVDRALIGVVRTNETRVVVDCVFADFASRRKLARRTRTFEGEEYGELEKEVQRFGNLLLAEGENRPREGARHTRDPLDSHTGMEDWDEENGSGGARDEPGRVPPKVKKGESGE